MCKKINGCDCSHCMTLFPFANDACKINAAQQSFRHWQQWLAKIPCDFVLVNELMADNRKLPSLEFLTFSDVIINCLVFWCRMFLMIVLPNIPEL